MKSLKLSMMLTVHLNYLLLVLFLFASVCTFPSTSLNERNQEISWEAWLLVDDQNNQNRQSHEGQVPRRRITPKSVFVAPTFSPENLPPCAEGYNSDFLGRCIKMVKIDENKHLEFLLSKLNNQYGSIDYDPYPGSDQDSEPTRVDIPLDLSYGDDYGNETPDEEVDMAIIVTPTTRVAEKTDNGKLGKRDDNIDKYEKELKDLGKIITTTSRVSNSDDDSTTTVRMEQQVNIETTTIQTMDEIETTTHIITTTDQFVQDATVIMESLDTTTVTELTPTTTEKTEDSSTINIPTTTTADFDTTSRKFTTTTPKITTYHPIATTYHPYVVDLSHLSTNPKTRNFVKFPEEEKTVPRSYPDGSYVRFPDQDFKYQQESLGHHTRHVNGQTRNFFNEIVTPQPSQKVQEIVLPPKGAYKNQYPKFFPSKGDHPLVTATTEKHPMKKSKNGLFMLSPSKWATSEELHKPIVLRFSRKRFNFDTNKFKNSQFYRSLPVEDLTYLFGYKNGQTTHR